MMLRLIAREVGTVHGHVPLLLKRLSAGELSPLGKWAAMHYLRWRMGRMDSLCILTMLESGRVSIEDLDSFAVELG